MGNIRIGKTLVGDGCPCYIVGEIGVNHNGDIGIASNLIKTAASAGCNAVKFQKRDPISQVPPSKREVLRDTPWGEMKTLAYREKIEFGFAEYREIELSADKCGVDWFASPWDEPSLEFLEKFNPVAHKVASASLHRKTLLSAIRSTGRPIILSTGMSTLDDIRSVVDQIGTHNLVMLACVSDYPAQDRDINLPVIEALRDCFKGVPIGYSGHEVGFLPSVLAVAKFGACMVERHITLDRGMKGSDHGASLEPKGLSLMVRDIRRTEALLGADGIKRITEGELKQMSRLIS